MRRGGTLRLALLELGQISVHAASSHLGAIEEVVGRVEARTALPGGA